MCFKQKGAISTSSGKPPKLVDYFPYLGSNISSTESDFNIYLAKVCYHSYGNLISDKIKFLTSCGFISTTVWMHHLDYNEMHREEVKC